MSSSSLLVRSCSNFYFSLFTFSFAHSSLFLVNSSTCQLFRFSLFTFSFAHSSLFLVNLSTCQLVNLSTLSFSLLIFKSPPGPVIRHSSFVILYLFSRILHLLAQHRAEDHLYVLPEAVVVEVVEVEAHLVWVDNVVVVPHC